MKDKSIYDVLIEKQRSEIALLNRMALLFCDLLTDVYANHADYSERDIQATVAYVRQTLGADRTNGGSN